MLRSPKRMIHPTTKASPVVAGFSKKKAKLDLIEAQACASLAVPVHARMQYALDNKTSEPLPLHLVYAFKCGTDLTIGGIDLQPVTHYAPGRTAAEGVAAIVEEAIEALAFVADGEESIRTGQLIALGVLIEVPRALDLNILIPRTNDAGVYSHIITRDSSGVLTNCGDTPVDSHNKYGLLKIVRGIGDRYREEGGVVFGDDARTLN